MNNGFPSEVTCCGSGDGCVGEEFAVYQIVLLQQIQCLYIGVGAGYGLIAERPERSADFEIGECVAYGCEERFFTYTPTGRNRGEYRCSLVPAETRRCIPAEVYFCQVSSFPVVSYTSEETFECPFVLSSFQETPSVWLPKLKSFRLLDCISIIVE